MISDYKGNKSSEDQNTCGVKFKKGMKQEIQGQWELYKSPSLFMGAKETHCSAESSSETLSQDFPGLDVSRDSQAVFPSLQKGGKTQLKC